VNVSTGNGSFGYASKKARRRVNVRSLENEQLVLNRLQSICALATQGLSAPVHERHRIFFATDSAPMADLLRRLPQAVTRRTVFPPPGIGRRFAAYEQLGYSDRAAATDTIIDTLLLGRCQALVRNESKFSRYALVSTDYFDGNVYDLEGNAHNIESLQFDVRSKGRVREAVGPKRIRAAQGEWLAP
jgi:hypothetical protein